MKKFVFATLSAFLLSVGVAFAGAGYGGNCSYGHSKEVMTEVEDFQKATPGIVLVEINDMRVELATSTNDENQYNVLTTNGQMIANNLSANDLSTQFPELYEALEG